MASGYPTLIYVVKRTRGPGRVLSWNPMVLPHAAFYLNNEVITDARGRKIIARVYTPDDLLTRVHIAEKNNDGRHRSFSVVPRAVSDLGTPFTVYDIRMLSYASVRAAQRADGNSRKAFNYLTNH